MPRLALILSGAVSLGSFEGGVLDELLYALDHLHATPGGKRYTLDVITGASAGAMTGALVARATMNDLAHRRALHDAWVSLIDILDLIRETPGNALLSREPVDRIADAYLTLAPDGEDRPAPFAPDVLRMAFTISNLNGVDYMLPVRHARSEDFTSTFFSDRRTFRMTRAQALDPESWREVREAAVASGTFPVAFAPAGVSTAEEAYRGHGLPELPDPFFFVDGGMFNNEPIREAVRLAREADGESLEPDRVFLLVDAHLNSSAHDPDLDDQAPLPVTAKRLMAMVRGEAAANDWLRSQRLDNQIAWRDELLDQLVEMVERNELARPDLLGGQLRDVAESIVARKRELLGSGRYPPDYLDRALERTARQNRHRLDGLSEGRRDILTGMIFVLNSISGLDKKSALDVDIIYADPERTAGDQLASFGGFFDEAWREHDYRLGRQTAHELLPEILGVDPYPREAGAEYDNPRDLSQATMNDVPRGKRIRVRDAVLDKAEGLVKEALGGGFKGWLAWKILVRAKVKGKMEEMLEL